jgi:septal ring factor EnvC (AmiA/AmiB activator)
MRAVAWIALSTLLLPSAARPGQEPSPERAERIEKVRRELRENEEALGRLRSRASSVLDEMAAAEAAVRSLEERAAQAEAEARTARARAQAAEGEEQAQRQSFLSLAEQLAPRLRARYALSRQRKLSLLLSAESVSDLLRRWHAFQALVASDLALFRKAQDELTRLEARRQALEESRREQARWAQAAQESRGQAELRRESLAQLHATLLGEQGLRERMFAELQRTQAHLSNMVAELKSDARAAGLSRRRGKLPFPARGPIEVGFGKVLNPKFNTVIFQNGVDLRAPLGAEVRTVASGTVVHAGPFRGYGNLLVIDHGGGYHTLYAHLREMRRSAGERVEEGETIATVGDTGSLKGPYLYFEIREDGKPVDPVAWLGAPP